MLQRGGYVPSRPSTTSPGRPQALPGRICFSCPGCSASTEMSVRHQPKRLFGFIRNRCTTSSEMAVRHTPKWLFVFARDTQIERVADERPEHERAGLLAGNRLN